jgi:glutathione S-transferase
MSDIVVYGVPGSPFMRAVQMGLEEKKAAYRVQALGVGESKSEAYLRKHPFGRVPAFEHGNFGLYETQAILRYLDDILPEPPLQPRDPKQAARMNQIIGINDWYLFPMVARVIVFHRVVGPLLLGAAPDEAAIAAAVPDARLCLRELNRLLGDQSFLAGEQVTLADLMLAPQLYFLAGTPEGGSILKDTPLLAWLERMNARPSMNATLPPMPLRQAA